MGTNCYNIFSPKQWIKKVTVNYWLFSPKDIFCFSVAS